MAIRGVGGAPDARSRWAIISAVFVVVFGLGVLGCSSGSDSPTGDASSESGSLSPTSDDAAAGTTEAPGPCPTETALELVNAGEASGPLEMQTEFAEVTLGDTADLVFATYEIPEDPQFGVSAPVGVPDVPAGETIVQFTLYGGEGDVFPTGTFVDDDAVTPRIMFAAAYNGAERLNPLGEHTIEVTEVTDEHICGTITGIGETELQTFPYVEGSFILPVV